jgi:hypothetical protein
MPESNLHIANGKEILFYGMVFLVMLFALVRLSFSKYFTDLFRLFFRTTLKQRQLSEQLVQAPLPSVFLNLFFLINAGLYLSFWIDHNKANPFVSFWWLLLYVTLGLTFSYLIKFASLKISGWLFNVPNAVESYIFLVFLINKMLGILLMPILFVLAFSGEQLFPVALTISWCLIGALLGYRIFLSYQLIRRQIKVSGLHFLLYVLGFEISPLLVLYKAIELNFG